MGAVDRRGPGDGRTDPRTGRRRGHSRFAVVLGEERPLTGVDVDIVFVERATGAPSTITFRCVVLADGDHIVREAPCGDEHSVEPDRIPRAAAGTAMLTPTTWWSCTTRPG